MVEAKLETVQNWARWCPGHNGAPPIMDLNGYKCTHCGKTVCVGCIYKTEKGFLCTNCIKKIKPKHIEKMTVNSETQKKHSWYFKVIIIWAIPGFIFSILGVALNLDVTPYGIPILIYTLIFIALLIVVMLSIFKEKSKKKKVPKILNEQLDRLDNLSENIKE